MFKKALLGVAALAASVVPALAEVRTKLVEYQQGGTPLQAYVAWDDSFTGKRPAVYLIHRRDGMSDLTRTNAQMIAKLGYVVFAADIFGKSIRPKDEEESKEQSAIYNKDRPLMRARALAGLEELKKEPNVDTAKIAAIGYCFGGTVGVELVETGAPLLGLVTVHGSFRDFTPGAAQNIKGSVLILHGAEDKTAPLSEVDLLVKELRKTKINWGLEIYGGADHGFTTPVGPYNERANAKAWEAAQKFFGEVLGKS